MKRWERAKHTQTCGGCGEVLRAGAPILVYEIPPVSSKSGRAIRLIRCGPCEGGAPPDLPALIVVTDEPRPALDLTRLGVLPLDFKARAAEREPGEEG